MPKSAGMTLIELLISLAIVAVLIVVVAPSIQSVLQANRVTADINNLSALARQARFAAINERTTVTLCPSQNYASCTSTWTDAKIIFIDDNNNGTRDTDEPLIASADALSKSNVVSGISGALQFSENGAIAKNASIVVCPYGGEASQASAVLLSLYGRIATAKDTNDDGIKENAAGTNLTC